MFADAHLYFGVALAGLVSFLSPCVLPLVPPYLIYLGGTSMEQMTDEKGLARDVWLRVVLASVFFVLGFTTVFVALGAGASAFGQLIGQYKAELSIAAGGVIILFGLHFLGLLKIPLLYREARYHARPEAASLLGAYVIGLAFAFGWTPCVGPILATVLAVATREESLTAGIKLLLAYSLGLGVPFILAAVAIRPFLGFMQKFRRHLGTMEKAMGLMLVLTGLLFAGDLLAVGRTFVINKAPILNSVAGPLSLVALVAGAYLVLREATAARSAGLAGLVVGMALLGGSINSLGNWALDTFPGLAKVEEALTPKTLQKEILKQAEKP
jgi:cytochrome c-type biogenesis protein